MVGRIPVGLSASAVFHAAVVTFLVLLPLLGRERLPEAHIPSIDVMPMPFPPPVRPSPEPVRPRAAAGGSRRASPSPLAIPVAQVVPAVPQSEGEPIDNPSETTVLCLGCVAGVPNFAEGPVGVGLSGPEGSGNGTGGAPIRAGSGVEPPRKLVHVAPRYPELAQRARLQGTVALECVIDPAGSVAEVRLVSGPSLLRDAAMDAVRQWRYTPTKLNGVPVSVLMTVTVRFTLRSET